MAIVKLTRKAQADLRDISYFYLKINKEMAVHQKATIAKDLRRLADNPMLGSKDEDLGDPYRYWYVLGMEYRVYFKRLGSNSIKVLRIWPSRKPPLEPSEIVTQ
jgi:plasmid stabilization system protein ParE